MTEQDRETTTPDDSNLGKRAAQNKIHPTQGADDSGGGAQSSPDQKSGDNDQGTSGGDEDTNGQS